MVPAWVIGIALLGGIGAGLLAGLALGLRRPPVAPATPLETPAPAPATPVPAPATPVPAPLEAAAPTPGEAAAEDPVVPADSERLDLSPVLEELENRYRGRRITRRPGKEEPPPAG